MYPPTAALRAALVALAGVVAVFGPGRVAAEEVQATYGSWNLRCEPMPEDDGSGDQCFIFQNLVLKRGGQRVFNMAVGFIDDSPDPIALVTLPLGISLPPGATLSVDDEREVRFPIERCMPAGCRAGVTLAPELVAALERGREASVNFFDGARQPVSVKLSLDGFEAALAELRDEKAPH